jgi:hypothetical protein
MIDLSLLNKWRIIDHGVAQYYGDHGDDTCGAFQLKSPVDGQMLTCIASTGAGWDHVSVSRKNRAPNQAEMDHIFRLFFREGETAVQYFVPRAEHINVYDTCLHLWRSRDKAMPRPPQMFV